MSDHIVSSFDQDLESLRTMIAQMGGLAEEQLGSAVDALMRRDVSSADDIIAADVKIDDLESAIEEHATLVIAKRQPVARDLRAIMVALRIASDLERIGDLAKNIAKRTHGMSDVQPQRIMMGLRRMSKLALEQLKNVLDAYTSEDADRAVDVWRSDEELDALYNSVFRELLTYMMEDPRVIGLCTHLLFGAKNLERIGDHATNIAENVFYMVRGETLSGERPKSDRTSMTTIHTPAK